MAGLFRHHLASDLSRAAAVTTAALVNGSLNGRMEVGSPPGEIHVNSKVVSNGPTQQQASSTTNSGENALDYTNRCYANQQPKMEPQSEVRIRFPKNWCNSWRFIILKPQRYYLLSEFKITPNFCRAITYTEDLTELKEVTE